MHRVEKIRLAEIACEEIDIPYDIQASIDIVEFEFSDAQKCI
jgi:hypothetical protein